MKWLHAAKKRYGLVILNYSVTSNHIHLLVVDDKGRKVIPNSIQLVAGRTGQEYNRRKKRKGAFWEDRYHATAIEDGDHLLQCMAYIDLNMVRAGVVDHPSRWPFCGYSEIQKPIRENILIDYDRLQQLSGFDTYDRLTENHKKWVETLLADGDNTRDDKWSRSIAVGSQDFTENIKSMMGVSAIGRKIVAGDESYQIRELNISYGNHFETKKSEIDPPKYILLGANL